MTTYSRADRGPDDDLYFTDIVTGVVTPTVPESTLVQETAPSNPAVNDLWWDTATDELKRWNGSSWRPSYGTSSLTETFTMTGTVVTTVGTSRIYNDTGRTLAISRVRASLGTAGTTDTIIDVNKAGTTLFTTQANRPTLPNSVITDTSVPDVTAWEDGTYLTVDVDNAGAGAETLTVTVVAS